MEPRQAMINGIRVASFADFAARRVLLRPHIRETPVFSRADLPGLEVTRVLFKFEHLQVTGTFKPWLTRIPRRSRLPPRNSEPCCCA